MQHEFDLESLSQVAPEHGFIDLEGFVDDRSLVCIATFVDGFAAGWFFAVPEAFRDALDIKQTQRVFNGNSEIVWTQGKLFSFRQGDVLYDSHEAYDDKEWRHQVSEVRLCIQVQFATPSKVIQTKSYRTSAAVTVLEDEKAKKNPVVLRYTRSRMNYGLVRFAAMTPDTAGRLVEKAVYETDQESFVSFLQTGLLRFKDGKRDFTND